MRPQEAAATQGGYEREAGVCAGKEADSGGRRTMEMLTIKMEDVGEDGAQDWEME